RRLPPDRDRGDRDAEHAFVDRERLAVPERLHRDQRAEQRGCQELDHAREALGERAAPEQHGTDRLDRDRAGADERDDEPGLAHRLNPMRQAALAAMIGTPAGANGVSARAIAAPRRAAATCRWSRASGTSSPRNNAAKAASSPNVAGSPIPEPTSAPIAVPATHDRYRTTPAPSSMLRENRPSPSA